VWERCLSREPADNGHEWRKNDRVVSGIYLGQLFEVGSDGPGSCAGRSLCPGVDEFEPGGPHEPRE
jgi:hypothetical protein